MAFNLKKVVKALLFSSSQPLAIEDIQAAFARFHEQALLPLVTEGPTAEAMGQTGITPAGSLAGSAGSDEPAESIAEPPPDPELYADVPSLVTSTQIREVVDEIAAELRVADQGLLLIEGASGYRLVTHPRFARWVRILRAEPPPLKLSPSSLETLSIVAYRQPVTRVEIEAIRGVSAEAGVNKLLERELIYITGRAELPGRPLQYGTTDKFLELIGIKSLDELPASNVLSTRQLDDWLQNAMSPTKVGDAEMGLPEEPLPLAAASARVPGSGTQSD
ncbi:MAG: SMC-Scp complex subunit ScpB [Opitutaceae bacterium]|nr:SMC-Scp complex subunit ScpB [Opitutaceae bacterium]